MELTLRGEMISSLKNDELKVYMIYTFDSSLITYDNEIIFKNTFLYNPFGSTQKFGAFIPLLNYNFAETILKGTIYENMIKNKPTRIEVGSLSYQTLYFPKCIVTEYCHYNDMEINVVSLEYKTDSENINNLYSFYRDIEHDILNLLVKRNIIV